MKRTPSWIFVAAVAVKLAALGLCAWATDRAAGVDPATAENGARSGPGPAPRPRFAVPPHPVRPPEAEIPPYLADAPPSETQLLTGSAGNRSVTFGFAADGNIRFVDVDGVAYTGQVRTAHAELREVAGAGSVMVRIGVEAGGALQATVTGERHGSATFALEPVLGWNAA